MILSKMGARVIDISPITTNCTNRFDAHETIVVIYYVVKVSFGNFIIEFRSKELRVEQDYIQEALLLMNFKLTQQKSLET